MNIIVTLRYKKGVNESGPKIVYHPRRVHEGRPSFTPLKSSTSFNS